MDVNTARSMLVSPQSKTSHRREPWAAGDDRRIVVQPTFLSGLWRAVKGLWR